MSDNQIKYGSSSWTLRLEMPPTWPIESISTVSLVVRDTAGTIKIAAANATLYTATTLNGALTAGSRSITLANTAGNVVEGDRLRIAASVAGGSEDVEVESYNSTSKVATLKRSLYRNHTTGTAVYGMWASKGSLDFSSATGYPAGLVVVAGWTPSTGGVEITDLYTISKNEFEGVNTIDRFRVRFPDFYLAAEDTIRDIELEAERQVRYDFLVRDLKMDRIVDRELIMPALLTMMAYLIALGRGDQWAAERDNLFMIYEKETEKLFAMPIWVDEDQSQSKDVEEEVRYHSPVVYTRGV